MVRMKHYWIAGACVTVFLIGSTFLNRAINSRVQRSSPVTYEPAQDLLLTHAPSPASEPGPLTDGKPVVRHSLTPDDPARFGILVQKDGDINSPNHWEQNVHKTLVQSGWLEEMEQTGSFSGAAASERDLDRRLRSLEDRIKEQSRILQSESNNEAAQLKLQNLYMQRSTLAALKEKLLSQSGKKH
jgi:hypothetical protein